VVVAVVAELAQEVLAVEVQVAILNFLHSHFLLVLLTQ
jgi:hypothetical protein